MGILPTRFATLRLFGLTDRVLIIDEAHAYDPYMQRQLETLLRMQAMNGGSAIVMTATLPLEMRQAYADAFGDGLDQRPAALACRAYPALATVGAETSQHPVKPAPAAYRTVRVARIDDATAAVDHLRAGVAAGASCVWIRNAVDDVIAAVEMLRAQGCPAGLLHARFALGDRLRHEAAAMAKFGRNGDEARATGPCGHAGRRSVAGSGLRRNGVRPRANRRVDSARRATVAPLGPLPRRRAPSVRSAAHGIVSRPGSGDGRSLAAQGVGSRRPGLPARPPVVDGAGDIRDRRD